MSKTISKYIWLDPFKRPLKVTTCCVVGVGTCILLKIAVRRVFDQLGIPADIEPSVEGAPGGTFPGWPDVIFLGGLQAEEIQIKMPKSLLIEIKNLGYTEKIKADIIKAFIKVGWLKVV